MGEAEVDLQPLITSAMAFGDPDSLSDMQIGRWLKSHDNALINDSSVRIVDGKVKQEVSLKLQNVESGEIDLELEWIALSEWADFDSLRKNGVAYGYISVLDHLCLKLPYARQTFNKAEDCSCFSSFLAFYGLMSVIMIPKYLVEDKVDVLHSI